MTAREMHIGFDLELQKINSFATLSLYPQEKDWILNHHILEYIIGKYSPRDDVKKLGFQENTKRLNDIQHWIKTKREIEGEIKDNILNILLPSDFLLPISSVSHIYKTCNMGKLSKIDKIRYKYIITLPNSMDGLKITCRLNSNSEKPVSLLDTETLPKEYLTVVNRDKQSFIIVNLVKELLPEGLKKAFPNSDTSIYWEKFKDTFEPNSFIITSNEPIPSLVFTTNNTTAVAKSSNEVYSTYNLALSSESKEGGQSKLRAENRVIEHEFLYRMLNSTLSKSLDRSPISVYNGDSLDVYFPHGAIIPKVDLTYICKPKKVDLLLNRGFNVEDYIARKVITNSVQYCKVLLENPNYRDYLQENLLTE